MNEAASLASEMQTKQLPPQIEFSRVAVEDVGATKQQGKYVARDVDYVTVTTRNGKGDSIIWEFDEFKQNWEREVHANRLPQQWLDRALANYERFKSGQEIPLDGTAIKGWGIISPAQQEMLIHLNIQTVEHLASINDEARLRIGMGALDYQRKAQAWIAQLQDKGPLTIEMAALKNENELLKNNQATMQQQIKELMQMMPKQNDRPQATPPSAQSGVISASDIIDGPLSPPTPVVKRHRRTKAEMDAAQHPATVPPKLAEQPEYTEI